MTLRPRYPCVIVERKEGFDVSGRAIFGTRRTKTRCDVIHIREGSERTTVREDSSASRGRAEEYANDARLLLAPRDKVRVGDLVELTAFGEDGDTVTFEIMRVQRRIDVAGRVHHIEIDGNRYAKEG